MPLKCQVYYPIFSYVVLTLYIGVSRWGIFRNTFLGLYLHSAVMFSVLFGVSSVEQSFRLSSLVGEV